jgi:phosphatidylglycerophosphate synthase
MSKPELLSDASDKFDYRKSVQKTEDKFIFQVLRIDKFLNRPLASLIVRPLYRTRVTPNHLTYLAFALGLAGAYFFSRGTPSAFLIGGILAQISSIMDNADGMLARAKNQMSEFGGQLDLFLDRINEFFLMAGVILGYYDYSGGVKMLILGLIAMALYFLQTSQFYMTKNYFRDDQKGETGELRSWLMFLIFLFGAINRLDIGIGVLFVASTVINFCLTINFFRLRKR